MTRNALLMRRHTGGLDHELAPAHGSRWIAVAGSLLTLAGLVFNLTRAPVAPGQWWQWGLLLPGVMTLVIGLFLPVRARTEPRAVRIDFRVLRRRWPDFRAKVKGYSEFFEYTLVHCLASPLQSVSGVDPATQEGASLESQRIAALRLISFLNRLTYDLTTDLAAPLKNSKQAARLVSRFETLLAGPSVLEIEEIMERLAIRSRSPEEFRRRLERFVAFKRSYEDFARAANQDLGAELFREYVP